MWADSTAGASSLRPSPWSRRARTPVERLEVPTRVQPLLAARIDRLPEREKQVLQTAAVIGQEFAEPVLERVAEKGIVALAAVESAGFATLSPSMTNFPLKRCC